MTDTAIEAGAPAPASQPTFADFDVRPEIVEALAAVDIVHPFPIQAMTLPVALGGHDIIGQAKTGTGKTLGLRRPDPPAHRHPHRRRVRVAGQAGQAAGPRRLPHP
jgi:hypothetical protein